MKYCFIIGLLGLLLSACQTNNSATGQKKVTDKLPAGMTLVEKITQGDDEIVIPYEKYRLDNGLTLIIHEDQSDPLVHVDITYHVGSAREEPGKSGFAHFFEHMMFQGSEHVADEQHFKLVSEAGGTMNGTTNQDRTNYYQTVPVNQLEKVLWLESDRMGFLLDAVTQKKFEVQRATVKNERAQRIENRPYGRLGELLAESLYPKGHPYSWPVIGHIDDLNRVNVNDLKAFFLRWYGPNNATLTIGGAVKAPEVLKLVNQYFAEIPRGPEVKAAKKKPASLDQNRYVSMEDNVHLPLIAIDYPTVYAYHKDEAALDILAEIIGQGKTSIFHKNLVETQIAVQASTSHSCSEIACDFMLFALPNPASGVSLSELENKISVVFSEFEERGVTDDDLLKTKAKLESNFIFSLQSVSGKVSRLAAYETFTSNPNYVKNVLKSYEDVTKEDVIRVYNKYIKNKPAVIASVVPKGQSQRVAKPDNFKAPKRDFSEVSSTSADDLTMRKTQESFDRSVIPSATQNPVVSAPALWRNKLDNGITVLGTKSLEAPTTSLMIDIPGGHYQTDKEKAGIASITAALLNESTSERSAVDLSLALQKLGSRISISAENRNTTIIVNTLTKNLDATLVILMEKLLKPGFVESEFARIRSQTLEGIKHSFKEPSNLASRGWLKLLNGDTIAGIDSSGSIKSVSGLSVADAKGFYRDFFKPEGAKLTIVSSLDKADVLKSLNTLTAWTGRSKASQQPLVSQKLDTSPIYLVHKDKAAQSVLRVGKHIMPRDFTGEFFRSGLMNFILGGGFNGRINLNLREDKGYTYGAYSYFWGDNYKGGYSANTSVRAAVTDKAFSELEKEIRLYKEKGMTQDEFTFMKSSYAQRDALKYETPGKKLRFMNSIMTYGLADDFATQQLAIINSVTKDELNRLAQKHLDFDSMIKLVVGDITSLKPKLEKLGYKVEELKLQ